MKLGTSSLVVAAFVGPGTVLTCATAGLRFGYQLGWVLGFAIATAFILQSLTAGTGILAGKGLGEALREEAWAPLQRTVLFSLVILGLWVGCAAFEMGNLVGAAAGLQILLGQQGPPPTVIVLATTALAAGMLLLNLQRLTQLLSLLVGLMSLLFVAAAGIAPVRWMDALAGLTQPSLPPGSLLTVVALIGTTVVTYNLFLHPSAAKSYWRRALTREAWRRELLGMALFLPLGGVISLAILFAGAAVSGTQASPEDIGAFAMLLEPAAGRAAPFLFGLGLFAAGITSAVTAPLAAAAGIRELFGWTVAHGGRYRAVWSSVLLTGLFFALTPLSPVNVILAAQAANGLLLPFMAAFVLYLTHRQQVHRLPRWYLALGVLATLLCAGLGFRTLWWVWSNFSL